MRVLLNDIGVTVLQKSALRPLFRLAHLPDHHALEAIGLLTHRLQGGKKKLELVPFEFGELGHGLLARRLHLLGSLAFRRQFFVLGDGLAQEGSGELSDGLHAV